MKRSDAPKKLPITTKYTSHEIKVRKKTDIKNKTNNKDDYICGEEQAKHNN